MGPLLTPSGISHLTKDSGDQGQGENLPPSQPASQTTRGLAQPQGMLGTRETLGDSTSASESCLPESPENWAAGLLTALGEVDGQVKRESTLGSEP